MPEDITPDTLLHAVLTQPSVEDARKVLTQYADRITREFLALLDRTAQQHNAEGNPDTADILTIGYRAAALVEDSYYTIYFMKVIGYMALAYEDLEIPASWLKAAYSYGTSHIQDAEAVRGEWIEVTLLLVKLASRQSKFEDARKLLSETRRRCRELHYLIGEVWVLLSAAEICLLQQDLATAKEYASAFGLAFNALPRDQITNPSLPDQEKMAGVLLKITYTYYYDQQDYESAETLAKLVLAVAPLEWEGYFLLGNSQSRLGRYEDALQTWEQAIKLKPDNAASHANLATALSQLDRHTEALAAISEAIRLAPDNPRYYGEVRGKLYLQLGLYEAAIADFTQMILLCEQAIAAAAQDLPYDNLNNIAHATRASAYESASQLEKSFVDIDYLIQQDDISWKLVGATMKGNLYEQLGQYAEAIAAYTFALELDPEDINAHKLRADVCLRQGLIDEAMPDLIFIARIDREPEAAIERLDGILEQHPEDAQARKWRGSAYQQAWRPSRAVADLTYALTLLPNDAEIYLRRGLARITIGDANYPEEVAWEETYTFRHIFDAINDLAHAVYLAPHNGEAVTALKWLVDRASGDERVLSAKLSFTDLDEPEHNLFSILPALKEPLASYWHSFAMSDNRRWDEAIKDLLACRSELLIAGFPVFATRIHLNLVDNYLRLYELQLALDHIQQAKKLPLVIAQPLSWTLGVLDAPASFEKQKQRAAQLGIEMAPIEGDYLHAYGLGMDEFQLYLRLFEAEALARIGDMTGAISALEDITDFEKVTDEVEKRRVLRSLIPIAIIMRDAGEYTSARKLLDKVKTLAEDGEDRQWYFNTSASIYARLGEHKAALREFRAAYAIGTSSLNKLLTRLRNERNQDYREHWQREIRKQQQLLNGIQVNIAANYFYRSLYKKALATLMNIDMHQYGHSEHELHQYYLLLAQVYWKLGKLADAQKDILQALAIVENLRGKLRLFDVRMDWQARYETTYHLAVRIVLDNNDKRLALELIEKSKSRAFIDQLATGHVMLPAAAMQLQTVQHNLERKKDLLQRLIDSIEPLGQTFIDYEVINALLEIDPDVQQIIEKEEDGVPSLSVTKIAEQLADVNKRFLDISRQIEEASLANAIVTVGSTLSLNELRQVMRA